MDLSEAIRFLIEDISIEDFIYHVRDRASEERLPSEREMSSWDLPDVKNYALACRVLKESINGRQVNHDNGSPRVGKVNVGKKVGRRRSS